MRYYCFLLSPRHWKKENVHNNCFQETVVLKQRKEKILLQNKIKNGATVIYLSVKIFQS